MRKRHAARPVLESVEDRLVLSVAGGASHAAQAVADHTARVAALAAHHATVEQTRSEAAADHQHASTTTHAAHHSPSKAKAKAKSSSLKSTISNLLLKSIFPF
jgi:ABC-type nickel/cobalt efflux system permease component RcnA